MNQKEHRNIIEISRRSFLATSLMALPAVSLASASKSEQNWPGFRGPGSRGIADGYPTRAAWNADSDMGKPSGILWRTEIPGLGHSSPIIWGDRIYVATAVRLSGKASLRIGYYGDIKAAQDNDEQKWMILCIDKNSGKKIWERVLLTGKPKTERHEKSTHANTTLTTDGQRLVGFFGSEGLYCFDLDGKLLWKKDLGVINNSCNGIGWGYSSSPSLYKDRIVLLCDDPKDPYVAAFQLSAGKQLWKGLRKGECQGSWGSPLIHNDGTRTQVVTNGWPFIVSNDLETGKELWRLRGGGDIPIPTPFCACWFSGGLKGPRGKGSFFFFPPPGEGNLPKKKSKPSNRGFFGDRPN